jgi:hypothetical protein
MNSTTLEELLTQPSTGTVATQQCGPSEGLPSKAHSLAVYSQTSGQGTATSPLPVREHIARKMQRARKGLPSTGTWF